jgi:hypothetical protein
MRITKNLKNFQKPIDKWLNVWYNIDTPEEKGKEVK